MAPGLRHFIKKRTKDKDAPPPALSGAQWIVPTPAPTPTPPTALAPDVAPSATPRTPLVREAPKSYAQLADIADEVVASSWDASMALRLWLRSLQQLAVEGKVYYEEGNYDMAFVRPATVLKLQRDVLPYHHPEWRTLPPEQVAELQRQSATFAATYSTLKALLHQRTAAYHHDLSLSHPSSAPALTLRNTVTAAVTSYTDSTAPPSSSSSSFSSLTPSSSLQRRPPLEGEAQPRRNYHSSAVSHGPAAPRQNRLRKAFGMGVGGGVGGGAGHTRGASAGSASAESSHEVGGTRGGSSTGGGGGRGGGSARRSKLPEPGAEEKEEEEEEVHWRTGGERLPPAYLPRSDPHTHAAYPPHQAAGEMPLPGEDASDDSSAEGEGGGIAYAVDGGGGGVGGVRGMPTWSDFSQHQTAYPPHLAGSPVRPPPSCQQQQQQQQQLAYPQFAYAQAAGMQASYGRAPLPPQASSSSPPSHPSPQAYAARSPPPVAPPDHHQQTTYPYQPHSQAYPAASAAPSHGAAAAAGPFHPLASPSRHPSHQQPQLYPPYPSHPPQPLLPLPPHPPSFPAPNATQVPAPSAPPATPTPPPTFQPSFPPPTGLGRAPSLSLGVVPASLLRSPSSSLAASPPSSTMVGEGTISPGSGLGSVKELGGALPPPREQEVGGREEEQSGFATTESGAPLRPLLLPSTLPQFFMDGIARENTGKGIETCGLLLGRLARNTLTVTHLLVPKQTGTSDTCETRNEEEQLQFQEREGLLTLGWIHTHPTQSCFLSSRDLHTCTGYQLMLAEAVAIVCAPRFEPSVGVFRLTDPPGLGTIAQCTASGTFHEHPDLPLYTDVDDGEWGHVKMVFEADEPGGTFECVDLR
ncbi:hypothetical protein JCM11251_000980 [Rhodosporidiobolus azoricus]